MFGGTTKINGIPNAIDQGVHNLHSHSEVQTFEVNDDDVKGLQHKCFKVNKHVTSRKPPLLQLQFQLLFNYKHS
jgi:hypothetical protein